MGGGGKGGGGGHAPIEQPNTLESAQRLKIIDLLCEGMAGQDVSFKNIYLDNTPIQNDDGSYNFTGIRVSALPGTHNQDYLAGFDSTDKIVSVGAEVKASKPLTRTITDPLVDKVRVTLALGSLVTMKDNGDRVGGSVSLTVKCGNKSYPVTISGKTTSAYHHDVVLTDLPTTPFNISVHRNTPDSKTDSVSNATHWVSYVESIDAKFSYPNSVVVGLEIDSAQFGGKIPQRTYLNKWTQIKVPNNYDPITRTYDGIWLGEFKTAWSDNPAWVFYDLVTDKRYGLGDRLGDFGCDKWALYQIAKYCDQIVPDGFGGHEPRFTCNAYLSEPRDAKALLDDLASVFRGIAVWDGQQVRALQDAKKDPVATYSNSNTVDGIFAYSGAAQKTIFTAAHVKYNDKNDNYATKTEYVANDEAIKRYGLNVKQVTAFGCTSRGQAARVGKWLIETSIRERQMVSFKVGREGIRHLPFDIIEIADNDYAGDMISGRVLSVKGNTITADREMSDIGSIRYYANGQSKTVSVQSINGAKITLADAPSGIEQLGIFSATKTDVKPRLFRALSIAEGDGTYTINAVQHDENKEAIVDQGVTFEQDNSATKHKPQVSYGRVSKDGDELRISWEGTNTTEYLIKIYKDGELYRSYTQDSAEIKLKGLPNGEYKAEIRGKSANGQLTEPVIKTWSIDYDIKGLKATPELFAIKLDWTNPTTVINKAKIEIYRSLSDDRASATKVATLPYPTDTFTQNGVKLSETHYFWLRLLDDQGNTGNWVAVSGQCSNDTSQIVASINGKITQTELSRSLIDSLQSDINTAKSQAISSASSDAANKVAAEAQARANAIQAEATARQQALAAQDKKQTDALTAKAQALGTQISAVEIVNDTQAQQLSTLTTKKDELVAGLEAERTARITGDQAEATARQILVSKVNNAESSINTLQSTKANKDEVASLARTTLQSEWQNAANTAKSAAQQYADAQVNAKSVSDKAYADGLVTAEEQRAINDANAKLAAAKADAKAKADAAEAAAKAHADAIEIGGRNLLKNSHFDSTKGLWAHNRADATYVNSSVLRIKITTTAASTPGLKYTESLSVVAGNYTLSIRADVRHLTAPLRLFFSPENGAGARGSIISFSEPDDQGFSIGVLNFVTDKINSKPFYILLQSYTDVVNVGDYFDVDWIKLEKGNKATDWTPAPEDVDSAINATQASIDEFKQTQATKDSAQTVVNNQTLSRINNAESSINTLQSTKANKDEVASLARTTLQSEWQSAANTAKSAAKAHADAIEIGGRNLLKNSSMTSGKGWKANGTATVSQGSSYTVVTITESVSTPGIVSAETHSISAGDYILSGYFANGFNNPKFFLIQSGLPTFSIALDGVPSRLGYYKISVRVPRDYDDCKIYFLTDSGAEIGRKLYLKNIKLEKGNKATDWTPAPEDVDSAINATQASIDEFKQTQATKDSAQTVVNNQTLSRINNAESSINTLQNTTVTKDKAQSTHTIKTQAIAGGRRAIAGIAIGAMANEGTAESEVIVMADNFGVVKNASDGTVKPMFTLVNDKAAFNGDLIADGTILGKHIKANQTLSAPVINGGSLNINNRFIVDQYGNTTIQSSTGNVGLKITDKKIEVYDESGRLRVRLGIW